MNTTAAPTRVAAMRLTESQLDRAPNGPDKHHQSDPFGDIGAKVLQAIDEEVADRRRRGLPIVVDRGNGVETLPY